MSEIRAHDMVSAQSSTEGQDISVQHPPLPSDRPESTTSPTTSCAGPANPFDKNSFTDDGYNSDGTIASVPFRPLSEGLSCWQRQEVRYLLDLKGLCVFRRPKSPTPR